MIIIQNDDERVASTKNWENNEKLENGQHFQNSEVAINFYITGQFAALIRPRSRYRTMSHWPIVDNMIPQKHHSASESNKRMNDQFGWRAGEPIMTHSISSLAKIIIVAKNIILLNLARIVIGSRIFAYHVDG